MRRGVKDKEGGRGRHHGIHKGQGKQELKVEEKRKQHGDMKAINPARNGTRFKGTATSSVTTRADLLHHAKEEAKM